MWSLLAFTACYSPHTTNNGNTDGAPARQLDDTGNDGGQKDMATRPPPTLPTCIGTPLPLLQSGERTYVTINFTGTGGQADLGPVDASIGSGDSIDGSFLIDFGATQSTIDLGAFQPQKPVPLSCQGDPSKLGAYCSFGAFDFFGSWGAVTLITEDYSFLYNSVRQAGILGTDFLSVFPFTLDYVGVQNGGVSVYNPQIWKSTTDAFCTDGELIGAGYTPLPTDGFYTNDFKNLRPLSDVLVSSDPTKTDHLTVPNVPTVPVTIVGIHALAQLDTGYDDRIYRHSINVNQALLDLLLKQSPVQITRDMTKDLYLTTCVPGLSQAGEAYLFNASDEVDFLTATGTVGRRDNGYILFVKQTIEAATACGGIETWTVPAAQFGASFLVDAQAAMFDPKSSRVWLPIQ